jgi:uroporphyrin-III C-methyltransferase
MKRKLSLIGAGPGDPELISLKALRALQQADVVLHDALVHEQTLEFIPEDTLRINVGKRAGKHCVTQEEIFALIQQYTTSHGHVARLKGGDPFVFGRGYEELNFARLLGIETEVIPGMSSITSLSTLQSVPLTHRGVSEGFWVVTGTTRRGTISEDLYLAAQSSSTVVILMGMRKLEQIVALFRKYGKKNTPVMIIQHGSFEAEKVVTGNINNIVHLSSLAGIGTPAIIVIGEVVRLHPSLVQEEVLISAYTHERAS